jgi:hypothetical protein
MDILVDVGTQEQQKMIKEELMFLQRVTQDLDPPLNITRVYVTDDFEGIVHKIEGSTSYKANRGLENNEIRPLAKMSKDGNGFAITISSLLYTSDFDFQVRIFILLHELCHIFNKRNFPAITNDSFVEGMYLSNLYSLFDEYKADRTAFNLCDQAFPEKTQLWSEWQKNQNIGFVGLITDLNYYDAIRKEIGSFRWHEDVDLFLKNNQVHFDVVSLAIIHLYASYHQYPDKVLETDLSKSKFVNNNTIALMEYLRNKYEEKSVNLFDGMEIITNFETNFGMRFEHREVGGYCHVLDI